MNWDAISAISEAVSVIAVIASLVYVAVQVKQNSQEIHLNTETAKVAAYHQAIEQVASAWMQPEFAILNEKYQTAPDSLSSEEKSRLRVLWSATLSGHEIAFELYKKGQIDEALWNNMLENNRELMSADLPLELLRCRPGQLSRALLAELSPLERSRVSSAESIEIKAPANITMESDA
ncbi:MAG: hypothetical protein AB7R40_26490 [Nitrospiraceae bacterium]